MYFIVSYHLYNQMKKKESSKSIQKEPIYQKESSNSNQKEPISQKEPKKNIVNPTCPRCGQDPYFCQCINNVKLMYHNFNPEKDKY
jgi:hypothetical protein